MYWMWPHAPVKEEARWDEEVEPAVQMIEFSERTCPKCGEPLNTLREGREVVLRCTCDWEKGFHQRVKRTIHPTFYVGGVKKMIHWRPPLFNVDPNGHLYNFMVAQKVLAIRRVYDFAFCGGGLAASLASSRNLFIRGPKGSGRGLIVASIKFYAAAKDVSATPASGDWALFKNEVMEAENFNRQGEIAKASLGSSYINVDLMTIENIRAEPGLVSTRRKVRGAGIIDLVLAKRQSRFGSMVFSSFDFCKEFGDALGDKLPEIINEETTRLILLFSPQEADVSMRTVESRLEQCRKNFSDLAGKARKKNWREESSEQEQDRQIVMDFMASSSLLPCSEAVNMELSAFRTAGDNPYVKSLLEHVEAERLDDPLSYEESFRGAVFDVLRRSKYMSERLTDKETSELASIMRLASDPSLPKQRALAILLKKKMSGISSPEENEEAESLMGEVPPCQ